MNTPLLYYEDFKYRESPELRNFLQSELFKSLITKVKEDVVIVLGWDGSMLSAIQKYHPEWKKFLWISFWHKWFLLNAKEWIKWDDEFTEKHYSLLQAQVTVWDTIITGVATNEIDIRSSWGKITTLNIQLEWKKEIQIAGDGILIATPAWSTGYNSSLGWPIIPHSLPAFVISPKAPWKPKWQAPILIHENEIIHIRDLERKHWIDIFADGKMLIEWWKDVRLTVQKNPSPLTLLILKNTLWDWESKVFEEQWFS